MAYLVDTNVLFRAVVLTDPLHAVAAAAIAKLLAAGVQVYITAQNLIEFCSLATRPASANGLGMTRAEANAEIGKMQALFAFLPETPAIYTEWENLLSSVSMMGRQVYDARLVAVMKANGITHLLTFDVNDFKRYPGIAIVHPQDV